jgi:hypothetical protein
MLSLPFYSTPLVLKLRNVRKREIIKNNRVNPNPQGKAGRPKDDVLKGKTHEKSL